MKDITKKMLADACDDFNEVMGYAQPISTDPADSKVTKATLEKDLREASIDLQPGDVLRATTIEVLNALGIEMPKVFVSEDSKPDPEPENVGTNVPTFENMLISDVCKIQVKKEIDACVERGLSRNKAAEWLAGILTIELGQEVKKETIRQKDKRARGLAKVKGKSKPAKKETFPDATKLTEEKEHETENVGTIVPTKEKIKTLIINLLELLPNAEKDDNDLRISLESLRDLLNNILNS